MNAYNDTEKLIIQEHMDNLRNMTRDAALRRKNSGRDDVHQTSPKPKASVFSLKKKRRDQMYDSENDLFHISESDILEENIVVSLWNRFAGMIFRRK